MHVEKYTKSAVGHLLRHYNRTANHISNQDIYADKTKFNYNLCKREESDLSYYKKRISQVKCQNRADVKALCDWIITLPKKDFTKEQEQLFFQSAYNFLAERYGEKNMVSAWVHKDEAGQPHLHFCFIPVAIDKKKGIEKVSAKEVLTRRELQTIHKDMARYMEHIFGYDIGILNGTTIGGNKSITELKLQDSQKELTRRVSEISSLKQIKHQSISELANTIKQKPSLISDVSKAINIALGNQNESTQHLHHEERFRSR